MYDATRQAVIFLNPLFPEELELADVDELVLATCIG